MKEQTDGQLIEELRRIRWICVCALAILVMLFGMVLYSQIRFWFSPMFGHGEPVSFPIGWRDVRNALERQQFDSALSMALELRDKNPDYYYGHSYLGSIYLAKGDLENAEKAYARAYELFPTEDNRKPLEAVRKRVGEEAEEVP